MKMMFLVLTLTFGLMSFASPVQPILSALAKPTNLSGEMLKGALKVAAKKGLSIDLDTMQVTNLGGEHYQVYFYLTHEQNVEKASVSAEVLVRDGQAYVFNFNVERIVLIQTFPGVSMGNN